MSGSAMKDCGLCAIANDDVVVFLLLTDALDITTTSLEDDRMASSGVGEVGVEPADG
jgi:hypothetical protein